MKPPKKSNSRHTPNSSRHSKQRMTTQIKEPRRNGNCWPCARTTKTVPRTTPYANVLGYDDRTQNSFFKNWVNNELQVALAHQLTPPEEFNKYVSMCIQLDNNIQNLKGQNIHHHHHPHQNTPVTSHPVSTSAGTAPGPMDLSAVGRSRKRGPIDNEEKMRRCDNNLCMYCGQPGHWAIKCHHQRQRINAASADPAPTPNQKNATFIRPRLHTWDYS